VVRHRFTWASAAAPELLLPMGHAAAQVASTSPPATTGQACKHDRYAEHSGSELHALNSIAHACATQVPQALPAYVSVPIESPAVASIGPAALPVFDVHEESAVASARVVMRIQTRSIPPTLIGSPLAGTLHVNAPYA
jgi:hypothetical protein